MHLFVPTCLFAIMLATPAINIPAGIFCYIIVSDLQNSNVRALDLFTA